MSVEFNEEESDRVQFVKDRLEAMRMARPEEEWSIWEDAVSKRQIKNWTSPDGKAAVALPLEQILIETYVGSQEKLTYQIE